MGRYHPKWIEVNVLIRDQLSFQSWLLIGALLQSALIHFLPHQYAFLPVGLSAVYIIVPYVLESLGLLSSSAPPVNFGRFTAHPPVHSTISEEKPHSPQSDLPDTPSGPKVVVFILGFQSAHPLRLLAPGTYVIGQRFDKMFADAESDPTSGLLGRCGPLLDAQGEGGNGMFNISYWESVEKLKAFHRGPAHSEGMKWYYANRARYPHIGLMHEIYDCPSDGYENVYINFRPFGLRETKFPVNGEMVATEIRGGVKGHGKK